MYTVLLMLQTELPWPAKGMSIFGTNGQTFFGHNWPIFGHNQAFLANFDVPLHQEAIIYRLHNAHDKIWLR